MYLLRWWCQGEIQKRENKPGVGSEYDVLNRVGEDKKVREGASRLSPKQRKEVQRPCAQQERRGRAEEMRTD